MLGVSIGLLCGSLAIAFAVLFLCGCPARGECSATTASPNLHEYRKLVEGIDSRTRKVRHQIAALDEMIEKSDRVIEQTQDQLARLNRLRDDHPDFLEREMIRTLVESGYGSEEIARLSGRTINQIRDAA